MPCGKCRTAPSGMGLNVTRWDECSRTSNTEHGGPVDGVEVEGFEPEGLDQDHAFCHRSGRGRFSAVNHRGPAGQRLRPGITSQTSTKARGTSPRAFVRSNAIVRSTTTWRRGWDDVRTTLPGSAWPN